MGVKIRVHTIQASENASLLVEPFATLFEYYKAQCISRGANSIKIDIDGLAPSANHMYHHSRFNTRLTPEARRFREIAAISARIAQNRFSPTGCTSAIILFESPLWLTKKREMRKMDCDNRVKPTLDGIESGTGIDDLRHWQFHVTKILSTRTRTTVYLFDLGDIVPYYLF